MLEVKDLYVGYYRDLNILQNISITADKGKITTVLGANGVGVAQHASTPDEDEYDNDDEVGLSSDEPPGSRLTSGGRVDTLATE